MKIGSRCRVNLKIGGRGGVARRRGRRGGRGRYRIASINRWIAQIILVVAIERYERGRSDAGDSGGGCQTRHLRKQLRGRYERGAVQAVMNERVLMAARAVLGAVLPLIGCHCVVKSVTGFRIKPVQYFVQSDSLSIQLVLLLLLLLLLLLSANQFEIIRNKLFFWIFRDQHAVYY